MITWDDWRDLMLHVPENPHLSPDVEAMADDLEARFTVVVPVSGGMDSTTAYFMAWDAGLSPRAVYVDLGQEYAQAEYQTCRAVLHENPAYVVGPPSSQERWQHIIPGRNQSIIEVAVNDGFSHGDWGELWFGNLAGETPPARGDKSTVFMTRNAWLLAQRDVLLVNPLRGLDKTDLVRWWAARDALDTLRKTKSCYHPTLHACGRCQACFRRMVAFTAAGYHADVWDQTPDWAPYVAKYEPLMRDALATGDFTRYSPARSRDTLYAIELLHEGIHL